MCLEDSFKEIWFCAYDLLRFSLTVLQTFFIAALLAMQYSRLLVHIFGGCSIFLMCSTLYCDSHAALNALSSSATSFFAKTISDVALAVCCGICLKGEGTIGRISCTKSHDCHLSCNRPIVPKCTSPTSDK